MTASSSRPTPTGPAESTRNLGVGPFPPPWQGRTHAHDDHAELSPVHLSPCPQRSRPIDLVGVVGHEQQLGVPKVRAIRACETEVEKLRLGSDELGQHLDGRPELRIPVRRSEIPCAP